MKKLHQILTGSFHLISALQGGESVSAKFSDRRRCPPQIIFTQIDRPMNALQLRR